MSPGSYKSALVSAAESTELNGFVLVFIELRLFVSDNVVSISVSSVVGLSNTNCGSCCFERRGRFRDGDSKIRMREKEN